MISERRKSPRFNAVMPALLELPDGHRMLVNTADLSRHGAKVSLAERLPAGIPVMIELTAPDEIKGRKIVQVWGNTLYSKSQDDDHYALGIEFDDPCSDYKGLVLALAPGNLH